MMVPAVNSDCGARWSASGSLGEQLLKLRPEVRDVRRELFGGHHSPAPLLELGHRVAPDPLGVVRGLGDRCQRADPVRPQHVACYYPHLDVAYLGAEYVVARIGDVRVARQPREQDDAFGFSHRRDSEHCPAARRAQYDLDAVHVGQLPVCRNGLLGAALRVLDHQFEPSPVDAPRGVDLVRRHLLRLVRHRAVGLARTRQRFHDPYPVGRIIFATNASRSDQHHNRQKQEEYRPSSNRQSHMYYSPRLSWHVTISWRGVRQNVAG